MVFYKKVTLQISKRFIYICGNNLWIIHPKELLFNKVTRRSRVCRSKNELLYSYFSRTISTATENLF